MNQINLKDAIKQAEAIAMEVHESLREAAFKSAFDALTQTTGSSVQKTAKSTKSGSSKNNDATVDSLVSDHVETLMKIDRTEHQSVIHATSVLDKSLIILQIAREEFDIDGLKPSQIAKVLTEKFRSRASRQAVQQALDSAGDKVDRVPRKDGAVFRIMAKGEEHLRNPDRSKTQTAPHAKKTTKKSSNTRSPSAPKPAQKKEKATRKRSGKTSIKQLIIALKDDGFFSSAKTGADIKKRLDETQGYKYTISELAPTLIRMLRNGDLLRTKNADSQYEYKGK